MSSRRHNRSAIRAISLVVLVAFLNLELSAVVGGTGLRVRAAKAAEGDKKVGIFLLPKEAEDFDLAPLAQALLRDAIDKLEGVEVVSGVPEPDPPVGPQVVKLVEEGFATLNEREADKALASFNKAYDLIIADTGRFHKRLMARVLKGRGVAMVMSGNSRQGREMMRATLNLWPDQQQPEYNFTLDVRNAFRDVFEKTGSQANGSISLVTDPPGSLMRVDGEIKGFTPWTVEDLHPGLHWVSAEYDGYLRQGAFVSVPPGGEASQGFPLPPTDDEPALNAVIMEIERAFTSRRHRKKRLRENVPALRGLIGADALIVGTVTRNRGQYRIVGVHDSGARRLEDISKSFDADGSFVDAAQAWLAETVGGKVPEESFPLPLDGPRETSVMANGGDELLIDPSDDILKIRKTEEKKSITDEWWFWTAVGAAGIGMVAGLYVLVASSEGETGPVGTIAVDIHSAQ